MSIIFDLKESDDSWANAVNEEISKDCPVYFTKYGVVGSEKWWKNYEEGLVGHARIIGKVTFIGKRQDFLNEEWDVVEVSQGAKTFEYDRLGYWQSEEISVGVKVLIESFEINIDQLYGPSTFIFERLVQVIET